MSDRSKETLTELDAYEQASSLVRMAMAGQPRIGNGPEFHPAEQDPLAWWCGVELAMNLYFGGLEAGRTALTQELKS